MDHMDVFVIEDDFDPLADLELVADDDDESQSSDYLPPIPDADKSVMPSVVPATEAERIDRLLTGIPGQQFRILKVVELCDTPKTMAQVAELLEPEFPQRSSVYDAAQLVVLLERAGALERLQNEEDADVADEAESVEDGDRAAAVADETSEQNDVLTVTPAPPALFVATADGRAACEARVGVSVVASMLAEEPQYVPLYRTIMEKCASGSGCPVAELNAVIDNDPLCAEPPRFCTYFLNKLEGVGALIWHDVWKVTELGGKAFAAGVFDYETGDIDAN